MQWGSKKAYKIYIFGTLVYNVTIVESKKLFNNVDS